jgi:hypothetical protein
MVKRKSVSLIFYHTLYVTPLRSLQALRWLPSQLVGGYRQLFVGVKPTGCDFYYLRPPSVGVMNEQSCNSTPYTLLAYTGTNLPLKYRENKKNFLISSSYKIRTYWNILTKLMATVA